MNTNYNPYDNYQEQPASETASQATENSAAQQYGGYAQEQPRAEYAAPVYGMPANPVSPKAEKKKKSGAGKIVAVALCCSLLGGAVGAGGALFGASLLRDDEAPQQVVNGSDILEAQRSRAVLNVVDVKPGEEMTAAEIYAANVNSTVGITTQITTNYFGYQTTSPASGSGFVLSADGYIVTNHHVIEDATSVKVTTYDGTEYDATIVGSDESNDIAVLKIDADNLTPVILGSSDGLNVGDEVIAIGNPLGELTFSLTKGWVSALNREITLSGGVTMNLIQTDCAINAGNSGGPLFNIYGEVIGVTNAKYSSSGLGEASIDNIGFAIPIDSVKQIISQIVEKGYVAKPYIGVTIESVSDDMVSLGIPKGAIIRSVTEDSPADQAGLQANDIVTEINGKAIDSHTALKTEVSASAAGDVLKMKVYRQGKTVDISVTVGEQETNDSAPAPDDENGGRNSQGGQSNDQNGQGDSGWGDFFGFDFGDLPFGNWF